jgi:hypothetical protein
MKKLTTIILAFVVVVIAVASTASAHYCLDGIFLNNSGVVYDVPVKLYAPNSTFAGVSTTTVEHQLRVAIDNWNEEGGAQIRPYFHSRVTSDPGIPNNGWVYVKETTVCDLCSADADGCERSYNLYGALDENLRYGSIVWIKGPACGRNYNGNLVGLLTHELGHSWGIDDEYDGECESATTTVCSAMARTSTLVQGEAITRRDMESLRTYMDSVA